MTVIKKIQIGKILKSRSFIFTLLFAVIVVAASDIQWIADEYVRDINSYNSFNKLICVSPDTMGAQLFFWIFPLLSAVPYSAFMYFRKRKSDDCREDNKTEYVRAFITGGIIIGISYFFDFWMLSLITRSYLPAPNDLICGYFSGNIFSECYYTHPRLFVFIYGIFGFCFGGAFSFLCAGIVRAVRKLSLSLIVFMAIYILEIFLSGKINITSWKELMYAEHYRNDTLLIYVINFISIMFIGFLFNMISKLIKHRRTE